MAMAAILLKKTQRWPRFPWISAWSNHQLWRRNKRLTFWVRNHIETRYSWGFEHRHRSTKVSLAASARRHRIHILKKSKTSCFQFEGNLEVETSQNAKSTFSACKNSWSRWTSWKIWVSASVRLPDCYTLLDSVAATRSGRSPREATCFMDQAYQRTACIRELCFFDVCMSVCMSVGR